VSFTLRRGEILGLAGLMGAGRTEVARAVFGADRIDAGQVRVHGRVARIRSPADAVACGIGYLSEDRKHFGLATGLDVETNIVLSSLRRFVTAWLTLDRRAMRRTARDLVGKLDIRTPSVQQQVRLLSGGNQQKIVIGKWLKAGCRLFIFDEPTRGIDVGAKAEIFNLIGELVKGGAAVLMISSELLEIVHVCDRAYVMRERRIAGHLVRSGLTEPNILRLAMHHA
jgi:ribose transport system ATP-binding protein